MAITPLNTSYGDATSVLGQLGQAYASRNTAWDNIGKIGDSLLAERDKNLQRAIDLLKYKEGQRQFNQTFAFNKNKFKLDDEFRRADAAQKADIEREKMQNDLERTRILASARGGLLGLGGNPSPSIPYPNDNSNNGNTSNNLGTASNRNSEDDFWGLRLKPIGDPWYMSYGISPFGPKKSGTSS